MKTLLFIFLLGMDGTVQQATQINETVQSKDEKICDEEHCKTTKLQEMVLEANIADKITNYFDQIVEKFGVEGFNFFLDGSDLSNIIHGRLFFDIAAPSNRNNVTLKFTDEDIPISDTFIKYVANQLLRDKTDGNVIRISAELVSTLEKHPKFKELIDKFDMAYQNRVALNINADNMKILKEDAKFKELILKFAPKYEGIFTAKASSPGIFFLDKTPESLKLIEYFRTQALVEKKECSELLKSYLLGQSAFKLMEKSLNNYSAPQREQYKKNPGQPDPFLKQINSLMTAGRLAVKNYSEEEANKKLRQKIEFEQVQQQTHRQRQEELQKLSIEEQEKRFLNKALEEKRKNGLNGTWTRGSSAVNAMANPNRLPSKVSKNKPQSAPARLQRDPVPEQEKLEFKENPMYKKSEGK